jgi:hypothetical protein
MASMVLRKGKAVSLMDGWSTCLIQAIGGWGEKMDAPKSDVNAPNHNVPKSDPKIVQGVLK